jgi:hypothetical protein
MEIASRLIEDIPTAGSLRTVNSNLPPRTAWMPVADAKAKTETCEESTMKYFLL